MWTLELGASDRHKNDGYSDIVKLQENLISQLIWIVQWSALPCKERNRGSVTSLYILIETFTRTLDLKLQRKYKYKN